MSKKTRLERSRRILVVDDDDGILDAMQVMLESAGYQVETSPDGEILEHLDKNNLPDLILLDVLLSGKDGRELCKSIKERPITKQIPIIMVSAHPDAEYDVKKCGANDFLAKPFSMNNLLAKVEKYTAN